MSEPRVSLVRRGRGAVHAAAGRPEAVDEREDAVAAQHGAVLAAAAGLEGGGHRAAGLRQPEQGGAVLRPHILGPQRQLVRAHRQHDREPRRAVPVLEPVPRARATGPGGRRGGRPHGGDVRRRDHRQVHVGAQGHIRLGQRPGREYTPRISSTLYLNS